MPQTVTEKQINPCTLTDKQWKRLASIAGLKQEDWGEAWSELHRFWQGDGSCTEREAITVLRKTADLSKARQNLREKLLTEAA